MLEPEKPNFYFASYSGGATWASIQSFVENYLNERIVEKLKEKLGDRFGKEYPHPGPNDFFDLSYHLSGGVFRGAARAMGISASNTMKLWPKLASKFLPPEDDIKKLGLKTLSMLLEQHAAKIARDTKKTTPQFFDRLLNLDCWENLGIQSYLRSNATFLRQFASKEHLVNQDSADECMRELGLYDRTLSQSEASIIIGAHIIEEKRPGYFGFLRPEILNENFDRGMLLGGIDGPIADFVKGTTAIPLIHRPHKVAEGVTLQDLAAIYFPGNLLSYLLSDYFPIHPKYDGMKVVYFGAGDRPNGLHIMSGDMNNIAGVFDSLKRSGKHQLRRATFTTIVRELERHNGFKDSEIDFLVLDLPENNDGLLDTAEANILNIMNVYGALCCENNAELIDRFADKRADDYIKMVAYNRYLLELERRKELAQKGMLDLYFQALANPQRAQTVRHPHDLEYDDAAFCYLMTDINLQTRARQPSAPYLAKTHRPSGSSGMHLLEPQ